MNTPFTIIGMVLALGCLWFAIRAGRRQRLVDNIPTSKTTGVFIGLVELKGTAEAESPLSAHLTGQHCVHYAWSVEEHWSRVVTETYRDSKGNLCTRTQHKSGWTTVASGGEQIPFYLRDDCGIILVQPHGARVEPVALMREEVVPSHPMYYGKGPAIAVANSDHRRRFSEQAIPLHAPIYVMGRARERSDVVAVEIARDDNAELFLISTRTEQQVSRGMGWTCWGLGIAGGLCSTGGFVLEGWSPEWVVVGGLSYLAAGGLAWGAMAYNAMIDLRQRVNQAWSNVDVQLKRRHDLIPNLVAAVQAMRDHEAETQTALAVLRNQLLATAPGDPGPDPHALVPMVRAVVERYPRLTADTNFVHLQESLVDIEQRIALARAYFNDIATFYNTRLQVIPDRFIARLARMTPRLLLSAGDFERPAVHVNLAD